MIKPGSRVVVAGMVPAKGDEDRPLVTRVVQAAEERGAVVVTTLVQRHGVSRARTPGGAKRLNGPIANATYLGRGKVQELAALVVLLEAEAVVFINALTPTQHLNLENALGIPVLPFNCWVDDTPG